MRFKRAAVAAAAMVAALCPTTGAYADHEEDVTCVEVPVDTIGLHAEVGDETVHVPAISNARLCYAVTLSDQYAGSPMRLSTQPGCGPVCFTLVVEEGDWTVASGWTRAYVAFDVDAAPVQVPIVDEPLRIGHDIPIPVCFAVGNPIPTCPDGMVEVPVPIIL